MSLSDFWKCSLWEFGAAVDGWNKAQGNEETPQEMTEERYEEMLASAGYL